MFTAMSQTQVLSNSFSDNEPEEGDTSTAIGFLFMGDQKFEIKKGCNNMGRDPQLCSIVLNHKTVSKLHSVIEFEKVDDIFILDNGSTNKTRIGKKYLKPHCRYKLEHGNIITLGNISLKFVLSFPNQKNTHQCSSMHNSGVNSSYLDGIFNIETQINSPHNLELFRNSVKSKTLYNYVPKHEKWKSDIKNKNVNISSMPSSNLTANNSTSDKVLSQSNFKTLLHCQMDNLGTLNSNIFSMATQYFPNNAIINNIPVSTHLDEINSSTVCDEINQNCVPPVKTTLNLISDPKSSRSETATRDLMGEGKLIVSSHHETRNFIQDDINAEKEKELILNDAKLIQSLEENFYEDSNQGDKIFSELNEEKSKPLSPLTVNVLSHCENNLNNENTIVYNSVQSNKKINSEEMKCNLEDLKKSFILEKNFERTSQDQNLLNFCEVKKVTTGGKSSDNDTQDVNDLSLSAFNKGNVKISSNKEFQELHSDSFLEITIEKEDNNEFLHNSEVTSLLLNELYKDSVDLPETQNKLKNKIPIEKQITESVEKLSSCIKFLSTSLKSSNSKAVKAKSSDVFSRFLNQNNVNDFNKIKSSKSTEDFEDFIETNIKGSQQEKLEMMENNEMDLKALYCSSQFADDHASSLTKEFGSFVPESSDEDRTLSDLEMIEDSPCFQRESSTCHNSLKRVVNNESEGMFLWSPPKPTDRISTDLKTNSQSSDFSDSSYVFEVNLSNGNFENSNCKKGEKRQINDDLACSSSSDSDSCDVIDMTPPKSRLLSLRSESIKPSSSKKTHSKITGSSQISFQDRSTDNEAQSNDDENFFNSIQIPSRRILEETLRKILLKDENAMEEKKDMDALGTGIDNLSQSTIDSLENNFFEDDKRPTDQIIRKRNRNVENIYDIVPLKKSKPNKAESKDFDFFRVEEKIRIEKQILELLNSPESPGKPESESNGYLKQNGGSTISKTSSNMSFLSKLRSDRNKWRENRGRILNTAARFEINNEIGNKYEMKNEISQFENNDHRGRTRHSKGFFHQKCFMNSNMRGEEKMGCSMNGVHLENPRLRITFTGFDSVFLDKIIKELGGEKTDDLYSWKVLVTDKVRRTVKFLCAIGLSIPITSPQWLLESRKKNRFLNPWNYLLKCEESEEKWNFELKAALEKSRNQKLLKGFYIFATDNVKPPVKDILNIVKCCGGTPLHDRPQIWTKQTIVVSCLEDKKSWPSWKFKFVHIVHYEFILSGVLQQSLDFETYKLR